MKTFIINPPCEPGFDRSGRWPAKAVGGTVIEPLFLAYAAAVLEKEGLAVDLIDCRPYYISQKQLLEKFDGQAGLAVIQTSTPSIMLDLDTAKKIKQTFPKMAITLVGPHVSVLDKLTLNNNPFVDFIARGEYEYIIRDLAKCLNENNYNFKDILGLTWWQNKEIIQNIARPYIENLDDLPFPARHFLPMESYFEPIFKAKRTFRLVGSRGCPYGCTFCLWTQTMYGRKTRFRKPEKIVDEMEELINTYKANGLYFEDDTFTLVPDRVIGICDEIIKRKMQIPWHCMGRVDTINEGMLRKMKEAGCVMIRYGVESSSQEILNNIKKNITVDQIIKAFKMTQDIGIESHATYTFGLPGETEKTIKDTIKFAIRLNSDYAQFATVMPFPGTELYAQAEKNGWLKTKDWSEFNAVENSVLEYPNLEGGQITEAAKKAYRKFYLRPCYIIKRASRIKTFSETTQLIKGAFNLVKKSFLNNG